MLQEIPKVRLATPEDEPALMAMCKRLHDENGMQSFDEGKVRDRLWHCFERKGSIVGVIGPPDQLEACTCLTLAQMHYTSDTHLEELWNYVEPEYRQSRNIEALVLYGKECAEKLGMPLLTGIVTNKQMAGKVRLYQRLLGPPAGAYFVHNTSWKRAEPMGNHTELIRRLREAAQSCNDGRISVSRRPESIDREAAVAFAKTKLASLLRDAADALAGDDNLWGSVKPKATIAA